MAQEKLSPRRKEIVKAIQKEASVFVPNDLSALEQICGTVKVNETQEALELNEKMKNEAGAFLAPSENQVYAKTGLKKRGVLCLAALGQRHRDQLGRFSRDGGRGHFSDRFKHWL
jgi:hypothetical protein